MLYGHITIDRKIMEWEWYRDLKTRCLFFHMLLKANWKDGKFEGKVIPRGSFVSSLPALAFENNMTENEVRTAIKHLKKTGEVTVKTYSRYSVFTVNKYCLYQDGNRQNDGQNHRQITDESQADNGQVTGRPQASHRQITGKSQQ